MPNQSFKFKGGVWIGYISATWPFGVLKIGQDELVIAIENLPFLGLNMERRFKRDQIEKIRIVKYFPIIGYGIRIVARDKKMENRLYFWYNGFRFKNLIHALKESGWL